MISLRKMIAAALCGAVALGMASCGNASSSSADGSTVSAASPAGSSDKKQIVCTAFAAYDWARELTKGTDNVEITYLLGKGVDMHSFQPTADDILKISTCDLFVYVGGESDEWAEDALANATNKDIRRVALLPAIGSAAKTEEVKEGMQGEEEEEEEHEGHDEAPEYDEHVWLSVRNAKTICEKMTEELSAVDKDNADSYKNNLAAYSEKLDKLDGDFKALADGAKNKTLIFGDRFPFRYFVEDYGFDYYAAFVGCSAETEASFETVTFLAGKVDELNADTVYTIENSDGKIANTIIESSKAKSAQTAVLDSIQSVTTDRINNGETYLSMMEKNLEVLKQHVK
ncbi:MAG: zinc ABC transporter substrate-binding protein [Ruminococcus sp.]|nr:zinc ABC transporter substrate-binding protein [Ruminococcus sp.]